MTVLITLHDVEPAVRLNADLERHGVKTEVVSPLDDIRGVIRRVKPEMLIISGDLTDRLNQAIVQEQLWAGVVAIGLCEPGEQAEATQRLRSIGYVELHAKPIDPAELVATIAALAGRQGAAGQ